MPLLADGVPCFQVVFTMPGELSSLTLGNRRKMFNLLFRSAWHSLKHVVENEQQFEAAAAMVLHTWNQKLDAHVHVHAVIPGGGPSLKNPGTWKAAEPPPHEPPDRGWLCDADDLRDEFRDRFLDGLRRLHRTGKLKLEDDWKHLRNEEAFNDFLAPLEQQRWVTYIQSPPTDASSPADVVKYLTRYVDECQQLLGAMNGPPPEEATAASVTEEDSSCEDEQVNERLCPHCGEPLDCLEIVYRESWRRLFFSRWCPAWYRQRRDSG